MAGPISLWRAQHLDSTVYLLGSIHALTPAFYPLPAAMDNAFDAADRVVFEVDLQRVNDSAVVSLVRDKGLYPTGQYLDDHLSAETRELLSDYLLRQGEAHIEQEPGESQPLSLADIQQMRPWYLSLVLGMRELKTVGYDPELGIDRHYFDRARAQGKPTGALETAEAQILLLATDTPDGQDLGLRSTLTTVDNLKAELEQLIVAWQTGDVDSMLTLSLAADGDDPALDQQFKRLIDDRNMQMLTHIQSYLELSETTLVVVGALHMGGETGLLSLLRQDYVVTQIDDTQGLPTQDISPKSVTAESQPR